MKTYKVSRQSIRKNRRNIKTYRSRKLAAFLLSKINNPTIGETKDE